MTTPLGGAAELRQVRVLVVDDDAVMRELTAVVVADEPALRVVADAHDGATAVRTALLHRPDVLVLDHDLGDMTAGEVLSRLRAAGLQPRVVLHSGRVDVHEIGRRLGVAASVAKTDGPVVLLAALQQLLPP